MLSVIKAGLQTTVQGRPREGYRSSGISSSGPLDYPSMQIANLLVGNDKDAAVLEITLGQFSAKFTQNGWLALTGADCAAKLGNKSITVGWCYPFEAGDELVLNHPNIGMRSYLAICGGIDIEHYLGSASTDLNAHFGGFQGRALLEGDEVKIAKPTRMPSKSRGVQLPVNTHRIRAITGPEYDEFSKQAKTHFWHSAWQLSPQSSRIGFRLAGPVLERKVSREMRSHGLLPGVIQVPHNGQPIILMADAQTTGGYPKIASVIEADLHHLAQVRLGDRIEFVHCTLQEAYEAHRRLSLHINAIERGLNEN